MEDGSLRLQWAWGLRHADVQACRYTRVQVYMCADVQAYRCAGMLVLGGPRISADRGLSEPVPVGYDVTTVPQAFPPCSGGTRRVEGPDGVFPFPVRLG